MAMLRASNVTKVYPERQGPRVFFGRGGLLSCLRREGRGGFAALDGVSLEVEAGESVGIIGSNGSGKSTLLKLLAGVTLPTSGEVEVHGRVASLLELGAGFHPMLTGRENIYLNASIYGLRRQEVDHVLDDIIAFSGIAPFIDKPVDTYSSGMYVRIAFSVAAHINPDIFLVDEVLAVGDEEFQRKCRSKMGELREAGKTILFVSHDLGIVNTVCERVVLLNRGKLLDRGSPQRTFAYYLRQVGNAAGTHRLEHDGHEALFSNGKLSLFKEAEEITAPEGVLLEVQSMGQHHMSPAADWRVLSSGESRFVAEGLHPRLPCRMGMECALADGKATLSCWVTAEHAFPLEALSLSIPLPAALDRWSFDGEIIETAPLAPAQTQSEPAAMPDSVSRNVTVFGADPAQRAALGIVFAPEVDTYLHLMHGDYLSGLRRLYWHHRAPAQFQRMEAGERRVLGTATFDLTLDGAVVREQSRHLFGARLREGGGLRGRLGRGRLLLESCDGRVTAEIQTLICVGDLWTNSTFLASGAPHEEQGALRMASRSGRLPLTLHWTLRAVGDGLRLDVDLEASAPVALQECNLSLLLPPGFTTWTTVSERGSYPDFTAGQAWQPLPSRYRMSPWLQVSGGDVPTLEWTRPEGAPEALPAALNTGASQAKRVAQWLRRAPGAEALYFPAGNHPLLSAIIRVMPE